MCWFRFDLTCLLADQFTDQVSKPINSQTGLANTVDALASKSEWGQNAQINSNNLASWFVEQDCRNTECYLICSPAVEACTDAAIVSRYENGEDNPQEDHNI